MVHGPMRYAPMPPAFMRGGATSSQIWRRGEYEFPVFLKAMWVTGSPPVSPPPSQVRGGKDGFRTDNVYF